MGPVTLNLTAYSDAGLYEVLTVITTARLPQDLSGWSVHASAVESVLDAAEAVVMSAAIIDAALGTISVSITAAAAAALFGEGDTSLSKTLTWTLLAKPYGTYIVKLFGGTLTVHRGAGRWT